MTEMNIAHDGKKTFRLGNLLVHRTVIEKTFKNMQLTYTVVFTNELACAKVYSIGTTNR